MKYFAPTLFDGHQFSHSQLIDVSNGKVISVKSGLVSDADVLLKGTVCPGFIDVQVNGGGGKLFNNEPALSTLLKMSAAHGRFGTTSMLPTLITDSYDKMSNASSAVCDAIEQDTPCILGIHFEGPHLSVPKKGIHPDSHIRAISDKELALFLRKDLGIVCVTLAPENVSIDIIKELVSHNVIVCLGHSNADSSTVMKALEAGATGFTHLFNAMSALQGREAGMTGAALLSKTSYAGLIVDMLHVCQHSAQLAICVKTPERLMLVSDSMSHVGTDQTTLMFAGERIIKSGNKLSLENGTLAGSALDMASAVKNCIESLDCLPQHAFQMASRTPACFLGLDKTKGQIKANYDADFICINEQYQVTDTFAKGLQVFNAETDKLIEALQ